MSPSVSPVSAESLLEALRGLYIRQAAEAREDEYLRQHAQDPFPTGTVRVFQFYRDYLPPMGRVLDWGCRHAPDACLLRVAFPGRFQMEGCDFVEPASYPVFHRFSEMRYRKLEDRFRLPYEDASFDVVIAAGVLEHVAMDYESLKELYRVLRIGGRLIVTYLPNALSLEERWIEWRGRPAHQRRYRQGALRSMLLHTGFCPLACGYQTQLDLLPGAGLVRNLGRLISAQRFTSCLCAVAEKVVMF
jgi:SAM-dependent methyltransferase